MRMIVCGGRDYRLSDAEENAFRALLRLFHPACVMTGGSSGVDRWAADTARALGYDVEVEPAQWGKHGNAAGPIRNKKMAEIAGSCGICVVFNGGRGTSNMAVTASEHGLRVIDLRFPYYRNGEVT